MINLQNTKSHHTLLHKSKHHDVVLDQLRQYQLISHLFHDLGFAIERQHLFLILLENSRGKDF
jgi:hypothetical protein